MRYFKTSKTEIRDRKRYLAAAVITAIAGFASQPMESCQAGHPSHGPIYRTLDALAGGIEKVIDVAGKAASKSSSCDAASCDDGCDAMTLHEMEAASESAMPVYTDSPMDDSSMHGSPMHGSPMHGSPMHGSPMHQDSNSGNEESGPKSTMSEPMSPTPLAQPAPPTWKSPQNSMPRSKAKPTPAPQPMRDQSPQPMPIPEHEPMREPLVPVEDGWFDSLSPEPATPTREQAIPKPRALRAPSDTIDTLEDPFKDDLQGRRQMKSANQPASYWEPW